MGEMMKIDEMFEKSHDNYNFYVEVREELVKDPKYHGKYVVLKDREIVCAFADEDSAHQYMKAQKKPRWSYIVHYAHESELTRKVLLSPRLAG